eukprot:GHUV01021565.1.p1 GENE.GHUV01021565.1~~GHUV01021565.1.p1  ORF type:complete len:205 (+),score=79.51 GHUV01021565.1:100-714(+)
MIIAAILANSRGRSNSSSNHETSADFSNSGKDTQHIGQRCSSHPFLGGMFCMQFSRGITARIQPRHGTVVGLPSTLVKHYTQPITEARGYEQIGVALVHSKATVTGCLKVREAGQRASVVAKALGSTLPGRSADTAQQAAESITAMQLCMAKKRTIAPPPPELLSTVASVHAALTQQAAAVAEAAAVQQHVNTKKQRTTRQNVA